jgi:hypothetical protein
MSESIRWPMGCGEAIFYLQDKVGGEIAEARNAIVCEALNYDRTCNPVSHLFWLDDDVLCMPGALLELLAAKADIASGTYFLKADGPACQPLIWPTGGVGAMVGFEPDKVIPCYAHGMGLTLVKTEVYKRLLKHPDMGEDRYGRPAWYRTGKEADYFQDEKGVMRLGWTEDMWFLKHAQDCGFKSVAVTTKHAFGFHCAAVWECDCGARLGDPVVARRHAEENPTHRASEGLQGFPAPQWRQWLAGEPISWDTPAGKVVWE